MIVENKHGSFSRIVGSGSYGLIVTPSVPMIAGVSQEILDRQYSKLAALHDIKREYAMGQCALRAVGPGKIANLKFARALSAAEETNCINSEAVGERGLASISLSTRQRAMARRKTGWEDKVRIGVGNLDVAKGALDECLNEIPAAQLFDQLRLLCDVMVGLHAGGLFHRDIKMGNILAFNDADTWSLKFGDFGMAACTQEGHEHRACNPTHLGEHQDFTYCLYPWSMIPEAWPESEAAIIDMSPPSLILLSKSIGRLGKIRSSMMNRLEPPLRESLAYIIAQENKQDPQEFVPQGSTVTESQLAIATQCDWFGIFLILAACVHVFETPQQRDALVAFGERCLEFRITSSAQAYSGLRGVFEQNGGTMTVDSEVLPVLRSKDVTALLVLAGEIKLKQSGTTRARMRDPSKRQSRNRSASPVVNPYPAIAQRLGSPVSASLRVLSAA